MNSSTSDNLQAARNLPLSPGDDAAPGTPGTGEDICPQCRGSGKQEGHDCPNCSGTGRIVQGIGGG